ERDEGLVGGALGDTEAVAPAVGAVGAEGRGEDAGGGGFPGPAPRARRGGPVGAEGRGEDAGGRIFRGPARRLRRGHQGATAEVDPPLEDAGDGEGAGRSDGHVLAV